MEPRSGDRGDSLACVVAQKSSRLQWSRDPEIAVTRLADRRRADLRAASMEPRSGDRGDEIFARPPKIVDRASMEPRSGDRGDAATGPSSGCRIGPLQWSRDPEIAVTSLPQGHPRAAVKLQWSRDPEIAVTWSVE